MAANTGKTVRRAVERAAGDGDSAKVVAGAAGAAAVAAGAVAAGVKVRRGRKPSRAFRLKQKEALPDGLRRVVLGRIDHALEELHGKTDHSADEAVHEARKDLKKLRSVLRLARAELGDDLRRSENETFRDAARELSRVRDAQVAVETLDKLKRRYKKDLSREAVVALRAQLVERRKALEPESGGGDDAAAGVARMLSEARDRVAQWPLEEESFAAVEPGLRRVYRQGRRRFLAAREEPTTENLHEWRKRVKDLWYDHQLLSFTWPEQMEPAADQAHHLSELLGEDHDLAVLDMAVGRLLGDAATGGGLHESIGHRRAELQAEAFALGARLYAERPRAFTRRIEGWFEAAREGAPEPIAS